MELDSGGMLWICSWGSANTFSAFWWKSAGWWKLTGLLSHLSPHCCMPWSPFWRAALFFVILLTRQVWRWGQVLISCPLRHSSLPGLWSEPDTLNQGTFFCPQVRDCGAMMCPFCFLWLSLFILPSGHQVIRLSCYIWCVRPQRRQKLWHLTQIHSTQVLCWEKKQRRRWGHTICELCLNTP